MTIPQADLLVQVLPEGAEMRFQPGQQVLIGRDTDVQVLVAHPRASRHHASLTYQQAGWVLTDQSSNGTFVDGRPIHQLTVHGPVAIRVGDPEDGTGIRLATAIAGTVPPAPDPAGYQAVQAISPSPAGFAPAPAPAPAPPVPVPLAPAPAAGFAAQPAPGFAGPPVPGPPVPDLGAPAGFGDPPPEPDPGLPPGPGYGGSPAPGPGDPAGPAAQPVRDYPTPPAQGTPPAAGYGTPPGHSTALLPPQPGAYPPGAATPPGPGKAKGRGRGGSDHREPRVAALASSLHILVPLRSWLSNPGWTQGLRLLVIFYGLLPSVFIVMFVNTSNLTTPGWAYSLYLAPLWAMVFYHLIRPGKITKTAIVLALANIIGTLALTQLLTLPWETHLFPNSTTRQVLPWIYGVGYAEEITKALPVLVTALIVLYVLKEKLDVRMWMFLGCIAGLTFGVAESVKYVELFLHIDQEHRGAGVIVVLGFAARVFGDGFQHAVWAGISGFFIGMGVNYKRQRILLIAIGVSIPSVLHGLSDWSTQLSTQWYWIGFLALSLALFLGYSMSASAIERQVRKTPIFRGESMLMDRPSGFSEVPAPSLARRADPEPGVSVRPG
jgi:RsiW-degrading membrane proteinase PrsW (M82 family)